MSAGKRRTNPTSQNKKYFAAGLVDSCIDLAEKSGNNIFFGNITEVMRHYCQSSEKPFGKQGNFVFSMIEVQKAEENLHNWTAKPSNTCNGFLDVFAGDLPDMADPWVLYVENKKHDDLILALNTLKASVKKHNTQNEKSDKHRFLECLILYYMALIGPRQIRQQCVLRLHALIRLQDSPDTRKKPLPTLIGKEDPWTKRPLSIIIPKKTLNLEDFQTSFVDLFERIRKYVEENSIDSPYIRKRKCDFSSIIRKAPEREGHYHDFVLKQITEFTREKDLETKTFFTIAGGPGTGKSTIIASALKIRQRFNADYPCFFIDRNDGEYCKTQRVFEHLAIKANPSYIARLEHPWPEDEYEALRTFKESISCFTGDDADTKIIFFIDGLDESRSNASNGPTVTRLLLSLKDTQAIPNGVRFVLTSRPTEEFSKLKEGDHFDIDLDSEEEQSTAIKHFFSREIEKAEIKIDENKLDVLVEKAHRSFLYAQLVVPKIINKLRSL